LASPMLASKSGGESAACKAEVVVPRYRHAVDVHHSRSGVGGMIFGHIVGGTSAINRWLAGGDIYRVGEVYWDALPFYVCHHETEGTRDVAHAWRTCCGREFPRSRSISPGCDEGHQREMG
jgi:hypothetical protein